MATIHTTMDLPHGWHRWFLVRDEAEAAQIAQGKAGCYLFQSQIIKALYLLVPEEPK